MGHQPPTPFSSDRHAADQRPSIVLNPPSHAPEKCITCTPSDHTRQWTLPPGSPPRHRTLVLCFDGTGDSFDKDNSNVVQLAAMLKKSNPEEQLVYYQAGIGTYTSNVLNKSIFESVSKLFDSMFATKIASHITRGYLFLMENYRPGDIICLFGFSRGAITALALAGMIHKVGLLPRCNLEQLPFAYAMYRRDDKEGRRLSGIFKATFSTDVKINFVGVWDTVSSVGLIESSLPFAGKNPSILCFRHALSLDERRVKFRPFFYTGETYKSGGGTKESPGHVGESSGDTMVDEKPQDSSSGKMREDSTYDCETDFEEVFFAGVHCDIGGGSVPNTVLNSLARIPLRWMIRECFNTNTGIIFDACMLRHEVGLDMDRGHTHPSPLGPLPPSLDDNLALAKPSEDETAGYPFKGIPAAVISGVGSPFRWVGNKLHNLYTRDSGETDIQTRSGRKHSSKPEADEEREDALRPIFDRMKIQPLWNVLEILPWVIKRQANEDPDNHRPYGWAWTQGKGRILNKEITERGIKVHKSVWIRINAQPMKGTVDPYTPKIRFTFKDGPRHLTRVEWLKAEWWTSPDPKLITWVD